MNDTEVMQLGGATSAITVALRAVFAPYGLTLCWVPDDGVIPGSYWGASEAGLISATLYVRADTPVHSALHEACHFICADPSRRAALHTDAGGDDNEECAVCYLSIVLAAALPPFGSTRMLADMDSWGYSFRLGSAARWFHEDAGDARDWLLAHGLPIDIAANVLAPDVTHPTEAVS